MCLRPLPKVEPYIYTLAQPLLSSANHHITIELLYVNEGQPMKGHPQIIAVNIKDDSVHPETNHISVKSALWFSATEIWRQWTPIIWIRPDFRTGNSKHNRLVTHHYPKLNRNQFPPYAYSLLLLALKTERHTVIAVNHISLNVQILVWIFLSF